MPNIQIRIMSTLAIAAHIRERHLLPKVARLKVEILLVDCIDALSLFTID